MYGIILSLQPDVLLHYVAAAALFLLLLCYCSIPPLQEYVVLVLCDCAGLCSHFTLSIYDMSFLQNNGVHYHDPDTIRYPCLVRLGGAGRVTWDPPTTKWRRRMRDRDSTGRTSMQRDTQRLGTQPASDNECPIKKFKINHRSASGRGQANSHLRDRQVYRSCSRCWLPFRAPGRRHLVCCSKLSIPSPNSFSLQSTGISQDCLL